MNYLHLTHEPLDISAINQIVTTEKCGAISLFCGITRNNFDGKPVLSLEYEAYEPMALKQMQKICDEVRKKWSDIVHIAIYHRLGIVPLTQPSVIIAISSPHRQSSLCALTFVIDKLKQRVPIWKKEKYDNNEYAWKENKECKKSHNFNIEENVIVDDDSLDVTVPKDFIQISADDEEINRRIQCFVEKKRNEINLNNILDYTTMPTTTATSTTAPKLSAVATNKRSHFANNQDNSLDDNNDASDNDNNNNNSNDNIKAMDSCARTNSVIIKQEYSKCHLKVRRLENHHHHHHNYQGGPQRSDYLQTLDKLMTTNQTQQIDVNVAIKLEKDLSNDTNIKHCLDGSIDDTSSFCKMATYERLQTIEEHLNLPKLNDKEIFQRLKNIENRLLYLETISPEYKHFLGLEQCNHNNNNNNSKHNLYEKDLAKTKMRATLNNQQKKISYTINDIDNLIDRIQQQQQQQQSQLSSFSTLSS